MNLKQRIAGIVANLDDLQSEMEACSRAADSLQTDTSTSNGQSKTPWLRSIARHVKELQACARDQLAVMQELRDGIARLQEELKRSNGAVKPPPIIAADTRQQP